MFDLNQFNQSTIRFHCVLLKLLHTFADSMLCCCFCKMFLKWDAVQSERYSQLQLLHPAGEWTMGVWGHIRVGSILFIWNQNKNLNFDKNEINATMTIEGS